MNFELIKNSVADTIKNSLNNYGIDNKKIIVKNVYFDDKNIDKINSWSNLQKLKNKNRSMTIPIYADMALKKDNKIVSKQSKINIGQLPISTKNDSFLIDGIEYNVPLQLRRDPGIYTSQSDNGMFVTAINSAKGRNYKIELDPNTNVQKINIDGSRINLLPVLKTLGYDKKAIVKAWGNDSNATALYDINEKAADTAHGKKAIEKLYKKLEYNANPNATTEEMKSNVINYFKEKTSFNPLVNKVTLGTPYSTLTPKAFLDISRKLIDVSNGNKQPDDTENLMFKHVKLTHHLLSKKIETDFKKKLTASLTRNLKNKEKIQDIIQPGLFTRSIKSFFNESKIAEPSEQINPLHMISTRDKITLKGEGGITNEHTVSMDMKALHPSYFGFIDPLHTPDGAPGLVNHITLGTQVNAQEKLTNSFYDIKTGKIKTLSVMDVYDKRIGTPDQYIITPNKKPIPKTNKISVFYRNKSEEVTPNKVDYVLVHSSRMFDPSTNLVPFINSSSGNRISMSGKHSEQTISLINREAPLVSTLTKNKQEFVSKLADSIIIKSPVNGIVKKISPKEILIMDSKRKMHTVELRDNLELNQESFYHDEPVVKVGDKIKKEQILAKNNWTDNKGRLSLGINAKIGYFPYKGYNIEDGIVISDAFAKKITSQHLHVQEIHPKKGELNFPRFKLSFKNKYSPESYSKLDADGIVKNGSIVTKGNILIAYAKPFEISEEDKILGKLSKGLKKKLMDQSIVWHYDFPGKVVDVIKSSNLIKVKVKSEQPAEITDKLSGRYGNKGIISNIIPTSEMPMTADGEPLEVIVNPHGVASRINQSQMYEAALGKIAKKTGDRYLLENFAEDNNWQYVQNELAKHGVKPNEVVIDPNTKKELKTWNPVSKKFEHPFVGVGYIDKSVHQSRKKFDARSRGAYSINDMPSNDPEASHYLGSSASKQNPKSVDRLTLYSLLAHGSKDVVRDMFVNKGQRRDDVWEAIINGYRIPPPKISTATEKGFSMMKAAGINMQRKGQFIVFPALTDKDTLAMSSGKIPKPNLFLRGKNLMPIKGGMFDIALTGGTSNSTRYNHIDMGVKIPNPITKNAIKSLLNISETEFNSILKGDLKKENVTGTAFFEKELSKINVENEIQKLNQEKKTAPKTKINIINRKLRYLTALKSNNMKPVDYLISKYPVIPSKFRPIIPLPNGTIEPAPINNIYRDVGLATKLANNKDFPKFIQNEAKAELYNTISGLQGVTEPTTNIENSTIGKRNIRSILTEFGGAGSPKGGYLHSNLLSKTQDYIGNSVIAVSPDLGIDEVGIPYKMAEIMYEPFILRRLKMLGYKVTDYKIIKEKNIKLIHDILNQIVKERPVVINRNPSLHKGSVMAFNPVLTPGSAIKLNPLILGPFNADFDGDQMPIHVPISKEAVEQAYKMIPSLNFYNPKNDSAHINFDQEYVAGIALMSENGQKTNLKYANLKEAKEAYDKNLFRISDFIKIGNKITTLGREELAQIIPKEFNISTDKVFKKKDISELLEKMVTGGSVTKYTDVINKLKDVGAKYAYDEGYSFSIDDLKPRPDVRKKYLTPTLPLIKKHIADGNMERAKELIRSSAANAQKFLVKDNYDKHNRFFLPANYGARKISPDVMQQITTTPYFAAGMKDSLIEAPIKKSYSEGLDVHDSFNLFHGARKALVDKVNTVREPGVVTKDLIASFSGVNIMAKDCGTTEGVPVNIEDTFNLQGRVLAKKVNGLPAGTILDSRHLNELRKGDAKVAIVRSPLTCLLPKGVCSKSVRGETMIYIKRGNGIEHISLYDLFKHFDVENQIKENKIEYYDINNIKIFSESGWVDLQRIMRHPRELEKAILEIRTKSGLSIHSTEDHDFYIRRSKVSCPKCYKKHFSYDNRYLTNENRRKNPGLQCRNCKKCFTVKLKDLNQYDLLKVRADELMCGDLIEIKSPKIKFKNDPDINGYWLGFYLAEGFVGRDNHKNINSLILSQNDGILKNNIVKLSKKITNKKIGTYKKVVKINDIKLVEKLKNILGSFELCDKKKLPSNYLSWSNEYMSKVISGFIDGDGHISIYDISHDINITSTSYSILVQFQTWLRKNEIRSSITFGKRKYSKNIKNRKECFNLIFSANDLLLSLLNSFKTKKIKKGFSKSYYSDNKYTEIIKIKDISDFSKIEFVYDVTTSDRKFVANGLIISNCYGVNEHHQLPNIGDPIGIKAAQSLGETGTQSALSSHHLGGTVSAGSFRSGFEYTKHLLGMHDTIKNKAILAEVDGTVVSIKKGVNNQHIITIDKDPNPYIIRNTPLVKKGDRIKKGQPLDTGHIKIQELAELVPMSQVQSYLTKELEKSYAGTKILRRNTETIVKGVTDYSKVTNSGKSPFLEEDIVPNNLIDWIKKGNPVKPEDVIGWYLAKNIDKYNKDEVVDIDMVNDLTKKGITKIYVNAEDLQTKNILLGINSIPLVQPDIIKKMSYQRIRSALKEGPISGEYSNIHGAYPEPALIIGTEFGLPGFNYY